MAAIIYTGVITGVNPDGSATVEAVDTLDTIVKSVCSFCIEYKHKLRPFYGIDGQVVGYSSDWQSKGRLFDDKSIGQEVVLFVNKPTPTISWHDPQPKMEIVK